jgi:hypothetical protein
VAFADVERTVCSTAESSETITESWICFAVTFLIKYLKSCKSATMMNYPPLDKLGSKFPAHALVFKESHPSTCL